MNISISPPQLEIQLKPSSTFTQAYIINNNSSSPITLIPSVEGWLPEGNDGSVAYCTPMCPEVYSDYNFSLTNSDVSLNSPFSIPGNSSRQLVLKIKPPVQETDAYFTLFLTTSSTPVSAENSKAIGKIGSHILLTVSNTEDSSPTLDITKFVASPKVKDVFFTPINFTLEAVNTSKNFFRPDGGHLTITKGNRTIKTLPLLPQNLLPNTPRQLQCSSPDNLTPTPCELSTPLYPGLYHASITFNQPIGGSKNTTFFIFPYFVLIPLLLVAITTTIVIKKMRIKS